MEGWREKLKLRYICHVSFGVPLWLMALSITMHPKAALLKAAPGKNLSRASLLSPAEHVGSLQSAPPPHAFQPG